MAHIPVGAVSRHQLLLAWENNHRYGIVHRSECNICDPYKEHMADAAFDDDSSFQMARDELKRQYETVFANGVAEGRRIQRSNDEVELHEAREGIVLVRAQLEIAQAECDRLKKRVEDAEVGTGDRTSVSVASRSRFVLGSLREKETARLQQEHMAPLIRSFSPAESSLSDTSFVTPSAGTEARDEPPTIPTKGNVGREHPTYSSAVSMSLIARPDEASRLPQSRPSQLSASVFPSIQNGEGASSETMTNPDITLADRAAHGPTGVSWQTVGETLIRTPKYIKQMDKLLKEANIPGNINHYKKVKALCAEAHLAKDQKTDLQRYLLVKWKTPDWVKGPQSSSSHAASTMNCPPTNPLYDDPPEAWVAYYTAFPASCPLGVRRDIDGKPRLTDMRASRIIARLRPDMVLDERTTRAARMQFKETAVRQLFSIPGRYHRVLTNNNIAVAPQITYQPFMGLPGDITLHRVALHFAMCGISFAMADSDLEPWAKECVGIWEDSDSGRV